MNQHEAYEETRRLLADAGFSLSGGAYHHAVFGSWYVEVGCDPPLRVVWDGKDSSLSIDRRDVSGDWHCVSVLRHSPTDARRTIDDVVGVAGT